MSKFRERAAEVKARGVEERGNFEPHGTPLRIYKYWSNNAKYVPARENFCHFWRVVAIWAPLMFLRKKVVDFSTSTTGLVSLALIALSLIIFGSVSSVQFLFGLLVALGVVVAVAATFGVLYFFDTRLSGKAKKVISNIILGFLSLIAATIAVGLFALLFIEFGWAGIAVMVSAVVGIAGLLLGIVALSDYVSGRRSIKREKQRQKFANMTPDEKEEYIARKSEPGRVSKFFSSVGDFIVLLAQVVRVKKWKICPMVTVPKN